RPAVSPPLPGASPPFQAVSGRVSSTSGLSRFFGVRWCQHRTKRGLSENRRCYR
ncbi:hypothetical protein CFOL_v3_18537, partial [Cephalotus follicularis]